MISAAILTKNEEKNIRDCLNSLSFCDEVLVVDDYSIDKTVSIAKQLKARVLKRKLKNNFSSQRNFALEKAKYEWVLFVDADERVTKELSDEIIQSIKNTNIDGYYLKRKDFILDKEIKYGEAGFVKLLRLGRKNKGLWERSVHERWNVKGNIGVLNNPLLHYPHENIFQFVKELDYFSTLHAQENLKEGKRANPLRIFIMPISHFIKNYILSLGFLDKTHGFVIASLMSFHSFLSWSKMYLSQKSK